MLRLSGDLVHLGPQESEVFNVFGYLNPFQSSSTSSKANISQENQQHQSTIKLYRHPICCLNCSGYLNEYVSLDESNNKWVCPICEYKNPAFYKGNMLTSIYPELRSNDAIFLESARGESEFVPCQRRLLVLAFDYCINEEQELIKLLSTSLNNVPKDTKIAIISYSNSIQLLRLFAIQSDLCICVDTLSGSQNQAHMIEHLINKDNQLYSISATTALDFLDVIVSTLINLSFSLHSPSGLQINNGKIRRPKSVCAINPILDLASSLGSTGHLGSHLILFCTRSVSVIKPEYVLKDTLHIGHSNLTLLYSTVAKEAYEKSVWVDTFFVGLDIPHLDHLEAVSSASGGFVITGQSFTDASLLDSMAVLLKKSSAAQSAQDSPGVESYSSAHIRSSTDISKRELLPYYPLPGSVISVQVLTSPDLEVLMLLGTMSVRVHTSPLTTRVTGDNNTISASSSPTSKPNPNGTYDSPVRIPTPTKTRNAIDDFKTIFTRKSAATVLASVSQRHLSETIDCVFASDTTGQLSPGGSSIVSIKSHDSDTTHSGYGIESGNTSRSPLMAGRPGRSPPNTYSSPVSASAHSPRSYTERQSETRTKQEKLDRIISKVSKYAQRSLVSCGFCRADPAAELTLQLKYHPHLSVNKGKNSTRGSSSLSTEQVTQPSSYSPYSPSSNNGPIDDNDDDAIPSKDVQYSHIQCIVRQLYLSESTDEITATRVITYRIPKHDYSSFNTDTVANRNVSDSHGSNDMQLNSGRESYDPSTDINDNTTRNKAPPVISHFTTVPPPPTSTSLSAPPLLISTTPTIPPPPPPPPLSPPVPPQSTHTQSRTNTNLLQLPLSPEIGMLHFMRGLNWERHIIGLCKFIVSEYHDSVVILYGGAKQKTLSSTTLSSKMATTPRINALTQRDIREVWLARIDDIVRHISQTFLACASSTGSLSSHGEDDNDERLHQKVFNQFGDSIIHKNVLAMLRCLYHLHEGPLLDGPATQSQLSFLSRSCFLAMPVDTALPIVLPALTRYQFASSAVDGGIASSGLDNSTCDDEFSPHEPRTPSSSLHRFSDNLLDNNLYVSIPPPPPQSSFMPVTREQVPPESLATLSSSALLLDLGDSIIIRPPTTLLVGNGIGRSGGPRSPIHSADEYLSPELSGSTARSRDSGDTETMQILMQIKVDNKRERRRLRKLMQHVVQDAIQLCRRFPVPTIYSLSMTPEPAYRLLYARLSPSHMDVEGLQRIAVPQIATLSPEELEQLVAAAPVTDQPSFERYLWMTAPKYASTRKRYMESQYSDQPLFAEAMARGDCSLEGKDASVILEANNLLSRLSLILFGYSKDSITTENRIFVT